MEELRLCRNVIVNTHIGARGLIWPTLQATASHYQAWARAAIGYYGNLQDGQSMATVAYRIRAVLRVLIGQLLQRGWTISRRGRACAGIAQLEEDDDDYSQAEVWKPQLVQGIIKQNQVLQEVEFKE